MVKEGYTSGEEVANAVTHTIGSHLGAAMLALLVWKAAEAETGVAWKVTAGAIFGVSMILLYVISAAYHAVTYKPAKSVLHVMDHMAIFFLIAGTYTPLCLVSLRSNNPALAWSILGVEWGIALVGIILKVWTTGRFRFLSTIAYVIMGWVAIGAIVPFMRVLHGLGMMWLGIGGVLYTVGSAFYLMKSVPYAHMIWHLFVLFGTICHFFCVFWYVM